MTAQEQRKQFEEEGYLAVPHLLTPEELAQCREEIHRLHELFVQLEKEGSPAASSFQREPFAENAERNGLPVLRKIESTRDFSGIFRDLAAHPRLVQIVSNLLGPDLLLFRSTLMLKPALHGSAHGFHQDSAYWPMEPPSLVTCSIALTDATPENGCIRVVPRSHRWGLLDWGRISRRAGEKMTDREDVDLSNEIPVPLEAGSAVLFHSLTVHGSGPNLTDEPRKTALYAYFPPTVTYRPGPSGPKQKSFPIISGLGGRQEMTLTAAASD